MAGQFIDRGQRGLRPRQRRPARQPIFPGRAALTLLLLSETVQYTRRSSATEHASVRHAEASRMFGPAVDHTGARNKRPQGPWPYDPDGGFTAHPLNAPEAVGAGSP